MLKLCRVTKVKVFFLVLVNVFNFDLLEFLAAILERGLFRLSRARIEWLVKEMKEELERNTARSCSLASIGNAGKYLLFYFLQLEVICMEAL